MDGFIISKLILQALVCSLLLAAAWMDIRERRIPNRLTLALALLFLPYAFVGWMGGMPVLEAFVFPAAVASAFLIVTVALFAAGTMGGGDVKLIAATALFIGGGQAFAFALLMAFAGGVLALAMALRARMHRAGADAGVEIDPKALQVPYGVAIAFAGLWMEIGDVRALFN